MESIRSLISFLRRPYLRKIGLSLLSMGAYLLFVWLAHPILKDTTVYFSLFPVIVLAWLWGLAAGVFSSILVTLLEILAHHGLRSNLFEPANLRGWATGLLTLIGAALVTAWVRQLRLRLQGELAERQKVEAALLEQEAKLRQREQQYRLLFENMAEGIVIDRLIFNDKGELTDWVVEEANPAYEKILGINVKDAVGRRGSVIAARERLQITDLLRDYERASKTGLPVSLEVRTSNHKDLLLTAMPMTKDSLAVIFYDQTEQKQAIEAERTQRRLAVSMREIVAALTGTLELNGVLDRILYHCQDVASYDAVNLMLIENDRVRVVRHNGYVERGLESYIAHFSCPVQDVHGLNWIIEHNSPVIISDTRTDALWKVFPPTAWIKSYAGIPIQARGSVIGFLNFNSAAPGFFKQEDIERLLPFAEQAALAIDNARVYEETQRRSHRMALINRIAHTLNQPLELKTVLQVTLDCLVEALNLEQAGLALFNNQRDRLIIAADHPAPGSMSIVGSDLDLHENQAMAYILSEKHSLLIKDAQHDELLVSVHDYMISRGVISMLLMPLLVRGQVIGTIGCDILDPTRTLTAEEIELAETICNLAAVRIEQARQFADERRRASEMVLLYVSSLDVSKQKDLPSLLQTIVEKAAWLIQASGGTIYITDNIKRTLECRVSHHLSSSHKGLILQFGEGAAGRVAATGQPLIIPDYGRWPEKVLPDEQVGEFLSLATAPIIWQDKVTGVIQLARDDPQRPFTDEEMELLNLFSNQVAISLENARLYEEIQQVAIQDTLTGLYNRRGLYEVGLREIERARRFNRPLTMMMIDIDHFKHVNDTYGHVVGDEVLAGLAGLLRKHLRSIDIIGRYGGEEFIILLLEINQASADYVANRICCQIAETPIATNAGEIRVTVSVGLAELEPEIKSLPALIEAADAAMYQAKRAGRNQVKFYQK